METKIWAQIAAQIGDVGFGLSESLAEAGQDSTFAKVLALWVSSYYPQRDTALVRADIEAYLASSGRPVPTRVRVTAPSTRNRARWLTVST